ncbi:hypothetical protein [Helicobacter pylori]|uniref:hypothetical protein n=1 Tax=Helicobacter pylori TaxID=210 RepID=UPI000EB1AF1B|nr:hypothetical protein [Helicobacter pylori]
MILENASQYKDYLPNVFDALGMDGSFEVLTPNIVLNIVASENKQAPTKEQILEKLNELTLKTKKQELEKQINEICKKKIVEGFRSSALGDLHAYDLTLEDQANLQSLVFAGIDSVFRCAEVRNNVVGLKTCKKHTKTQLLQVAKDALKYKQSIIVFYNREKIRLNEVNSLEELEKFELKEYLT